MSENMAKVVKFLIEHPGTGFTIQEMSENIGIHRMSVWRELIRLESEKLLIEEQSGMRARTFRMRV